MKFKTENLSASNRYYRRKKLKEAGLPIPPELRIYRSSPEKKRADATASSARYREKNREAILSRNQARRARRHEIVIDLKRQPCADCGLRFPPVCMDFDHREGEEKVTAVATMVSNTWPEEMIVAEIAKCDIVCANCHRMRTATRAGWSDIILTAPEELEVETETENDV